MRILYSFISGNDFDNFKIIGKKESLKGLLYFLDKDCIIDDKHYFFDETYIFYNDSTIPFFQESISNEEFEKSIIDILKKQYSGKLILKNVSNSNVADDYYDDIIKYIDNNPENELYFNDISGSPQQKLAFMLIASQLNNARIISSINLIAKEKKDVDVNTYINRYKELEKICVNDDLLKLTKSVVQNKFYRNVIYRFYCNSLNEYRFNIAYNIYKDYYFPINNDSKTLSILEELTKLYYGYIDFNLAKNNEMSIEELSTLAKKLAIMYVVFSKKEDGTRPLYKLVNLLLNYNIITKYFKNKNYTKILDNKYKNEQYFFAANKTDIINYNEFVNYKKDIENNYINMRYFYAIRNILHKLDSINKKIKDLKLKVKVNPYNLDDTIQECEDKIYNEALIFAKRNFNIDLEFDIDKLKKEVKDIEPYYFTNINNSSKTILCGLVGKINANTNINQPDSILNNFIALNSHESNIYKEHKVVKVSEVYLILTNELIKYYRNKELREALLKCYKKINIDAKIYYVRFDDAKIMNEEDFLNYHEKISNYTHNMIYKNVKRVISNIISTSKAEHLFISLSSGMPTIKNLLYLAREIILNDVKIDLLECGKKQNKNDNENKTDKNGNGNKNNKDKKIVNKYSDSITKYKVDSSYVGYSKAYLLRIFKSAIKDEDYLLINDIISSNEDLFKEDKDLNKKVNELKEIYSLYEININNDELLAKAIAHLYKIRDKIITKFDDFNDDRNYFYELAYKIFEEFKRRYNINASNNHGALDVIVNKFINSAKYKKDVNSILNARNDLEHPNLNLNNKPNKKYVNNHIEGFLNFINILASDQNITYQKQQKEIEVLFNDIKNKIKNL